MPLLRRYAGWILLALILISVLLISMARRGQPKEVTVAEARRGDIVVSFTADATVEAKTVEIAPKMIGKITALLVREGEQVSQSQILALLDDAELKASVDASREAVSSARAMLVEAESSVTFMRKQWQSGVRRAEAQLTAARADLLRLQKGARSEEIAQAEQQVRFAEAQLESAEKTLARNRQLYESGAIAKARLDEAEAAQKQAQAQVRIARENLQLLRKGARAEDIQAAKARVSAAEADLNAAQSQRDTLHQREAAVAAARSAVAQAEARWRGAVANLELVTLRAPFAGVIHQIPLEIGDIASPQTAVMSLVEPTRRWVEAEISDEDTALITLEQNVQMTLPAYPGRSYKGRITEISPRAEQKAGSALTVRIIRTKIKILEDEELFRPGLEVDIEGQTKVASQAVLIPSDALVFENDSNAVYRIKEGRAVLQSIKLGYLSHNLAEILSGLAPGDQVVIDGKDTLKDGDKVKVSKVNRF